MNNKKYNNEEDELIHARGQYKVLLHEKKLGRALNVKNSR